MAKRRKAKESRLIQRCEFLAVWLVLRLARLTPLKAGYWASRVLGALFYCGVGRRRKIALDNLRHVYAGTKSDSEIDALARKSCASFIASLFETAKFFSLENQPDPREELRTGKENLESLFGKAREIHEQAGGCIFVTPHIGNWEFLPYVSRQIGIPLAIVVRPLDNPYLERLLAAHRDMSRQILAAKTNSMTLLQVALRQGKSVGMLPDQSTMKAITVDYFGRPATATPIPALLAIRYNRPIVVVACCRSAEDFSFEGFVSNPLWPAPGAIEEVEVPRLTAAMNREMEAIIRKYPEHYFWMHDRWKIYHSKGGLSL